MLAAKGMVVSRSKVGTRVRERSAWNMFDTEVLRWYLEGGVDRRFLRDLAEIRLAVEPAAAALAAARRSEQDLAAMDAAITTRSEEHTSELQSLMRISYAVFCLKKKITKNNIPHSVKQTTIHIKQ